MSESPLHKPLIQVELAKLGLFWLKDISWNESAASLYQTAIANGEVEISETGALVARTGAHTGRSPKDKFIVMDETTSHSVWWDNNQAISRDHFEALKADFTKHARMKSLYVQDLEACADESQLLPTRVVCEQAWHALFMRHLLKPAETGSAFEAKLTVINLPSFKADPEKHGCNSNTIIAFDLANRHVLIGGTLYAGEIKKAVFTVLNFLLPDNGVLPMHCSANVGIDGDTTIFFGLSGTGKTTLSADPVRELIGDDEHGWSENGVFNLENGCYAKVINLNANAEPQIFKATETFCTVLENVVLNKTSREVDFSDSSITENTRAAYPLSYIDNASKTRKGPQPRTIIMLTADAFGVLPPIAKLSSKDAIEYFLMGYTAKLAGTEQGVKLPEATFSACFGAPFLPRHPQAYASLLEDLISKHQTRCFLLNTGWTGGAYGVGKRISLAVTRKLLQAAISGELDETSTRWDENFQLAIPLAVKGIESSVLDPRQSWIDSATYDKAAQDLANLFKRAKEKFKVLAMQAAE